MIIVDTGAFIALLDKRDPFHQLAKGCFSSIREPLITTLPVITEACYLLTHQAAYSLLKSLDSNAFQVFSLEPHHMGRAADLMDQYVDLPMDFADASLVVLAEVLGHGRIITVDRRDFSVYRWKNSNVFDNLLFPNN
ncbi:MAG: PIN domain-containing protein [Cyanobacteria bacterium P01_A01_bin.116]